MVVTAGIRRRAAKPVVAGALTIALALTACAAEPTATPAPTATPNSTSNPLAAPSPPAPAGPGPAPSPSAAGGTDPRIGGSFKFALDRDPDAIDPRFLADKAGEVVVDTLFDSLVGLDGDLSVVPAAAARWIISDDLRVFTFTLRDGARFHNGDAVTAADFGRAFDRMADGVSLPAAPMGYLLRRVQGYGASQAEGVTLAGVVAIDERTLQITLDEPFADFLQVLANPALAPVPAIADVDPVAYREQPIGNGPFAAPEPWQHNQFVRVVRNPDYVGIVPYLDEVVFQIYAGDPSHDTQFRDFEAGQLNVADIPAAQIGRALGTYGRSQQGRRGPGVVDAVSQTLYYYGFNLDQPPFDDPEVRRAISLTIDRDAIAGQIMLGTRAPADSLVPPGMPGAQPGTCAYCGFDPVTARGLVEGKELPPITLRYNTGASHKAIAEQIASDLSTELGLSVSPESADLGPYVRELQAGEMGLFRLGWSADYASLGSYLEPLFSSASIGRDNLTRLADPEIDALLAEARSTRSLVARQRHYQEVERRVLDGAVLAPVMYYQLNRIVGSSVRGFEMTSLGSVDLSRVWIDAGA